MMRLFIVLLVAILAAISAVNTIEPIYNVTTSTYSSSQAQISVWLSAAATCGGDKLKTRTFKGPTTGFVVTSIIYDKGTDTQGYIGYLPSDKSIYVVFRGSESTKNWISNLDAIKVDYASFPECKCQVHKGFYHAEQIVFPAVLAEVKRLRSAYSSYAVKVTGHSLGAALAQLTSMDLVKNGIATSVYNYGQPRTGDKAYSQFANSKVTTWRVTHNKDPVPHLPLTAVMEFHHVCTEEFENASGAVKSCDSSCEDPTCADQFPYAQTVSDDHMTYLGLYMGCSAV